MNYLASALGIVGLLTTGCESTVRNDIENAVAALPKEEKEQLHKRGIPDKALKQRMQADATRIAQRYDRNAIDTLLRTIDKEGGEDAVNASCVARLSVQVIARIADPTDEHGLVSGADSVGTVSPNWHGFALAAVDLYHDSAARDVLLEFALKDWHDLWWSTPDFKTDSWDTPAVFALGFLRTYAPDEVRPKIEAALHAENAKAQRKHPPNRVHTGRADHFRAALSALDYAAGLADPADRKRYRDFEARLWLAWALTSRGHHMIGDEAYVAAEIFARCSKEGDEQFLLRAFDDPLSTPEETWIAVGLANRFSVDGKKRLEKIAEGNSVKAPFARRALNEALKR